MGIVAIPAALARVSHVLVLIRGCRMAHVGTLLAIPTPMVSVTMPVQAAVGRMASAMAWVLATLTMTERFALLIAATEPT